MPASPSLAQRAEILLNQLAQVVAQEADEQAQLEIENARQRASSSRQALTDARNAVDALAASGVTAPPIPSQILTDLAAARRTLRTAATAIVGMQVDVIASRVRSNSVNQALEAAEKYSRYIDAALNRSVEKKRQEILPDGIDKPIVLYPGGSDLVAARLGKLQTRLQRKVEGVTPSELPQRLRLLADAAALWATERPRLDEGLDRQHPEVRAFLRQAATEDGASWSLLTPTVQRWLGAPENTASLRIVLRG